MSKILILVNDYSTVYYFRRELLERLISEDHEVHVSVPADPANGGLEEMGCIVDEIVLTRTGLNPMSEARSVFSYLQQIRRLNPDVVLTYTAKPNIYGSLACQCLKIPYINNVTGLGSAIHNKGPLRPLVLFLQRLAYRASSCVFFQNSDDRQFLVSKNIVRCSHKLLPGSGVNLQLNVKEDYPSDCRRTRLIIVARIRKDKGFDELFTAIKAVCTDRDDVEFHIVGWYEDENYRMKLEEMCRYYSVKYHGKVSQSEVHKLISSCHALLHASHHEGMSNVLLEAAAAGRPCIASNVSGCKEVINDGETGYTFDVKNAASLIRSIARFLALTHDQKRAMGLAARKKVEREFDRQMVVDYYMDEISRVVEGKGERTI